MSAPSLFSTNVPIAEAVPIATPLQTDPTVSENILPRSETIESLTIKVLNLNERLETLEQIFNYQSTCPRCENNPRLFDSLTSFSIPLYANPLRPLPRSLSVAGVGQIERPSRFHLPQPSQPFAQPFAKPVSLFNPM